MPKLLLGFILSSSNVRPEHLKFPICINNFFSFGNTAPEKQLFKGCSKAPFEGFSAQVKEGTMPRGTVFVMQAAAGHFRAALGVREPS